MEETEELKRRLDLAEARLIGLTIAVTHLLREANPEVRDAVGQALTNTADYALSKLMTDSQIEGLRSLVRQMHLKPDDHSNPEADPS